ncbi:CBS domain-containing protein [Streptomyces sp. AF1A]|jgi:CBS-domain-containing membrane protein|uniref:CBS domain-containing protein n=1 Tax=Streptomyces sp. AF1A TaxID=3394350 RepID=UPI0039BC6F6D
MYGTPHIVSDVMTHTVAAVGRRAPFKEIVRLMQDWRVGALPVLEGEGRVVGVVSEADLLAKEELRDSPGEGYRRLRPAADLAKGEAVTAAELMSSPAVTVHAGATLAQAARIMARAQVKRLPVVDEIGLLDGMVSRADLLKVFLRGDDEIRQDVRREVVTRLFPPPNSAVELEVEDGIVTVTGRIRDHALVPVAARLVRAVEGVVDVRFDLAPERREAHADRPRGSPVTAREMGPVGPGASGSAGRPSAW